MSTLELTYERDGRVTNHTPGPLLFIQNSLAFLLHYEKRSDREEINVDGQSIALVIGGGGGGVEQQTPNLGHNLAGLD